MGILDALFRLLFGSRPATAAPRTSAPAPAARTSAPPPAPAAPAQMLPPPAPLSPAPPMQPLPPTPSLGGGDFISGLRAQTTDPIGRADFEAIAAQLGCEWEAVGAVAKVESGRSGFGPDGRMIILFEPHIFSRLTQHQYDASNPNCSYPTWGQKPYPSSQDGRWAQLKEAYGLNADAALQAASYGKFQILGQNHQACGFGSAGDFVADMAKSEARQLAAFQGFVKTNGLDAALRNKDWATFAHGYNGPGYAQNQYDQKIANAYAQLKSSGTA